MRQMHILLIHQYFLEDNDGGGSRWNEMSRIWVEAGHRVTVLAGTTHYMKGNLSSLGQKSFVMQTNRNGVKVVRCNVPTSTGNGFIARLLAQFSFVFSATWGGAFYLKGEYDVVLSTSPPLFVGIAGLVISRIKKAKFILEIRDLWPESAVETGVLQSKPLIKAAFRLEKFLYHHAKAVTVLTPAFKTILIHQKNVQSEKIWLIPNAADFTFSDNLDADFDRVAFRKSLGLDHCFIIIYVGAHGIANHLMQLIDAAEILKGTATHFLLIGDGPDKKKLMAQAKHRELGNVTFINTVAKWDIFKYILAADAGTSVLKRTEIFKTVYSNKTFDYFACQKPVLLAIDGISRQLIEDAHAGLYIEPENPGDFAKKVLLYLADPALAELHGRNGYVYASQFFDRAHLAQKYLQYIENMQGTQSQTAP
ncbi:glycosyltransferase family 4 protein [Dyadobacter chenhuakuii]|uniref:Glycosyltransferase family 4 protein n=1 Tax=Dyadobacter chenhuakuii TaxID=2909339 RepID=A0ABY4XGQ6_9BACT|nr:glycosyltransferase family 4 protein [Dyadobacter chenhuakuii]MCF2495585.1 glycosyltransferase family 4 protein [Dyadobacter chenhuakuii]USJ29620.1 glycosyltransferase family 4 protein [Dyadobacter chenhuakuii]